MTRLAVEGAERMSASDVEVGRDGPSFAFRTLELLHDALPGSDLTFVMGADAAAGLESWVRPERVLELARIAICGRPGSDPEAGTAAAGRLAGSDRAVIISMPGIEVSSSLVRSRVAAGMPIRWLVPDLVADLIAERGLYAQAVER
jgi:nicotinate-nucleotide adenylyltransferase